jgi:hypothetical protein
MGRKATRSRQEVRDAAIRRLAALAYADIVESGGSVDDDIVWAHGQQFIFTMRRIDEKVDAEIIREQADPESDPPRLKLSPHERYLLVRFGRRLAGGDNES